jgi:prepilin-type N-terminal cleavage/methylation domain-containing protein
MNPRRSAPRPHRRAFTLAELLVALALLAPLMVAGFAWQHTVLAHSRTARDRERWTEHATLVLASIESRALREGLTADHHTIDLADLRLIFEPPRLQARRVLPGEPSSPGVTLLDHLADASISPAPPRIHISLCSTWGDRVERFISPRGAVP